jgi:hypothetical protein
MRPKVVLGAAAVVAAAALVGGSVQATGALWTDQEQLPDLVVNTGFLDLTPGTRSGSGYTFTALAQSPVVPDRAVSAALVIRNSGSAPLRFRLDGAGPSVSTAGSTVRVELSASVIANGATCGSPVIATPFTSFPSATPSTAATAPAWRSLDIGAFETWCVTTVLKTVSGTQPAKYTHRFSFGAEST